MLHALKQTPDGKSVIVNADGTELKTGDVTQRVLHILPKLFVPTSALSGMNKGEIVLTVTCSHGINLIPEGGLVIRQPYPNPCYFVAGSVDIRNGWIMPIPDDIDSFDLTLSWEINGACRAGLKSDDWEVRHVIHVKLMPGSGNTFTMDASCWAHMIGAKVAPLYLAPVSMLGHPDDSEDMLNKRDMIKKSWLSYDGENYVVGRYLEENFIIPGIKIDQAYSIDAHQEEQHEISRC